MNPAPQDEETAAEQAAVRLLAMREHSRSELQRKLHGRFSPETLARVLDHLQTNHLLSDGRFAEQYAFSRMRKGYGPLRITQELRERGITRDEAALALEQMEIDWQQQLQEVHQRKFGSEPPADQRSWIKQARFLETRGFPPDAIRRLLSGRVVSE